MQNNVETTKAIFAAFGRGDVDFIISQLADDVQWEYGVCTTDVPWYQNRIGHAGARAFFQSLAAVEFKSFIPKSFLHDEANDAIAVLLDSDYVVRETGGLVSYIDAVLLLRFNVDGKVSHFAHRVDTAQATRAAQSPRQVEGHAGSAHLRNQTKLLMERFNAAFLKHDASVLSSLIADDCVLENTVPAPNGTRHVGKAACIELWSSIISNRDAWFEPEQIIPFEDYAIILWRYRWGQNDAESIRGVNIMQVHDGLIVSGRGYVKGVG